MEDTVLVFSLILLVFAVREDVEAGRNMTDPVGGHHQDNEVMLVVNSTFHMHIHGDSFGDTCAIVPFRSQTLSTCGYNSSSPLVLIIHGWSINGLMEEWIFGMASALKAKLGHVNVLISDWRPLALQSYPNAVRNSWKVGGDVATLLTWLEETAQLSMDTVHLIGYSLGAHVAGFAGSRFKGARKLGRITGLDPAGPHFEGVSASNRLSPDDAKFVDTIHTFAKSGIGLALGIRQPVGHVDFYPNGGSFQPGCHGTDIYSNLYHFGPQGLPKTIKCTHQRAVHLFTDSLLNMDQQMTAYLCRDDRAFNKGLCLDCKKDQCNILGYSARKVRGRSKGLYLKTGPQTPFKVYHYQIKVLLTNVIEPDEVSVSISLAGTNGQSEYVTRNLEHTGNKTYFALAVVGWDLGVLQAVWLRWEKETSWTSWWRQVSTMVSGDRTSQDTELIVGHVRLKSGESQEKIWFCGKTGGTTHLKPTQEQEFIRCQESSKKQKQNRSTRIWEEFRMN
ncbi:hepatic triacylglycerol lipase isoform X2 [Brachyhypopomus gauderio]|uniref:hepatic triacylglycerol lipase isoform X2 n=1 Tax=Brachyhypopomus gauderio TaxID=698409 RepID=UPI0040432B4A